MCAEGEKFPLIFDICVIVNNKIRGKKNSIVIFNPGSIFIPRTAFVVLNDRGRRRGEDRKGWRKGRTLRWLRSVSVVRISGIHVLLLGDIRPPRNPVMHCAFTRGRDTLSHPLYFSTSSHHPFPIVLSLPPPTNSYNYVHVPIYNPPSSSSTLLPSNKVQHMPMFRYRVFLFPSFSFLLVSRSPWEKRGKSLGTG